MRSLPASPSIAKGTAEQFTATGIYSDSSVENLTASVTWTSSATSVATVSGTSGLVTSAMAGSTTITAKDPFTGLEGSMVLTVTPAVLVSIGVTPSNPSIANGTSQQLAAMGTLSDNSTQNLTASVNWSSSSVVVATVSNSPAQNGIASSRSVGTATITATDSSTGINGSVVLTVTPAVLVSVSITPTSPSIAKGTSQQLVATGTYSDNSTQNLTTSVTWSSSTTGTATVEHVRTNGLASSVGVGSTTITATYAATSISGSAVLTVRPAALVSINVTPATPSIAKGTNEQFTATGTYSDQSTQNLTTSVTWSSSATLTATVSNASGSNGLLSSLAVGSTTVTATYPATSISGSTVLTVTPASLRLNRGDSSDQHREGLRAAVHGDRDLQRQSTQNLTTSVTWSSSSTATATVSNAPGSSRVASSLAVGSTTVTATYPATTISGSTSLTVTPAALVSIGVTPWNPRVAKGTPQQLTATGTYSDQSTQNLTALVTWSSSATATASVSNASGSNGVASSLAVGTTTITATYPATSVSGSTVLTVTPAALVSIGVTPAGTTLPRGATQQFTATGTYTDQSTQNLTALVTWSSSTPATATISSASGSKRARFGLAAG